MIMNSAHHSTYSVDAANQFNNKHHQSNHNFLIHNHSNLIDRYVFLFFVFSYSLITVLSLSGNMIILIVILKRRMRVVTNLFLANITIANLIYTVCSPLHFVAELYGEWIYFDKMCPLLPFFSTFSINLNTSSMMAASIERLMVIVYPFRPKLTKSKCILIILLIWAVSIFTSLPWLFILHVDDIWINNKTDLVDYFNDLYSQLMSVTNETNKYDLDQLMAVYSFNEDLQSNGLENTDDEHIDPFESSTSLIQTRHHSSSDYEDTDSYHIIYKACISIYSNDMIFRSYLLFLFFVQYLFPLLVLCITYAIITYYVYFNNSNQQFQCHNSYLQKNRRKLIKILILIVVCFNICWFPLQINAFIYAVSPTYLESKMSKNTAKYAWMTIHLLAFSHFCHNPFINGLLNKKFKTEIISLFKWSNQTMIRNSKFSKRNNNLMNKNQAIPTKINQLNRSNQIIMNNNKDMEMIHLKKKPINKSLLDDNSKNNNISNVNMNNYYSSDDFISKYIQCQSMDNSLFIKSQAKADHQKFLNVNIKQPAKYSFDDNKLNSKKIIKKRRKCELNLKKSSQLRFYLNTTYSNNFSSSQSSTRKNKRPKALFNFQLSKNNLKHQDTKSSYLSNFNSKTNNLIKSSSYVLPPHLLNKHQRQTRLHISKTRKITFAFNTRREIMTTNLTSSSNSNNINNYNLNDQNKLKRDVSLTDSIIELNFKTSANNASSNYFRHNNLLKRKLKLSHYNNGVFFKNILNISSLTTNTKKHSISKENDNNNNNNNNGDLLKHNSV